MAPQKFKAYSARALAQSAYWQRLPRDLQEDLLVVSRVLPFKVNDFVLQELVDWSRLPDDPIGRLVFPHRDMLSPQDYADLRELVLVRQDEPLIAARVAHIRARMNPHPAGQLTHNVPTLDGQRLPGLQHKYRQTVLYFPAEGQTCHAYCSFCFRWPQFVGIDGLKLNAREPDTLARYLRQHPEVSDVLVTGGDPLVMNAASLRSHLEPLLAIDSVHNLRIGTKSLSYWPQRFLTDKDSDDLLRLFEHCARAGKPVQLMAHFNHPTELRHPLVQQAIRRLSSSGVVLRMQSPLVRHVNDDASAWAEMWSLGVRLGVIPYYFFVERDTGAHAYFRIPLARALEIFQQACHQVSGLARTVRGPSMSTLHGKVQVQGVVSVEGQPLFVLQFLQARQPEWVGRPFFARFDAQACWLSELRPAFGEERFFFETEAPPRLRQIPIAAAQAHPQALPHPHTEEDFA